MNFHLEDKLSVNLHYYKGVLDRIIEKYSNLANQDGDEVIEVDLSSTTPKTLKRYMSVSEIRMKQMEAQSSTDVDDESLRAHDLTGDSQLNSLHQDDGECDDSSISSTRFSSEEEGEGMTKIDTSHFSQWSGSMMDFQPEDQDKELENSLRGNTSLMELYPSMITRLEQAWHRHNISEAADSVLRRYRKWRHQSQKSHHSNTFNATLRHCRPTDAASESSLDVHLQPPLRAQRRPLGRGRSLQRKTQQWPVVMDFSDNAGPFEPQNCSPDETFDVPEQGELSCSYSVSPPRPYPTAIELSLPHPDRTYIYSSPARRSPFQTRKPSSPQSTTRSPKVCLPQVKSPAVHRLLFPQEAPLDPALPLLPLSAKATGHNRLRHQLSFDASLLLDNTYTAQDLDRDFIKLYHRLVCQSKSPFFKRFPCRVCAKSPEASKNHSSSSLAALALSPHRSLLRKRACEESWDSSPGSKRSRDQSYTSSPGSKRHSIEMLRRRLSLAEPAQLRDGVCSSLTKKSLLPRIASAPAERIRVSREPGVGDH